jgi:hypothetical protein
MPQKRRRSEGLLQCRTCGQWLHPTRFRVTNKPDARRHTSVPTFEPDCRLCEQTKRDLAKNTNRPRALIEYRAKKRARESGVTLAFVMADLNYEALVGPFAAAAAGGLCPNCGHPFRNERDIQLDHCEPPRHPKDWTRLHARNLGFLCGTCNSGKGKKPYASWLDDQEQARLSVTALRQQEPAAPLLSGEQMVMFK